MNTHRIFKILKFIMDHEWLLFSIQYIIRVNITRVQHLVNVFPVTVTICCWCVYKYLHCHHDNNNDWDEYFSLVISSFYELLQWHALILTCYGLMLPWSDDHILERITLQSTYLIGASNLIVAAMWNTTDTLSVTHCKFSSLSPRSACFKLPSTILIFSTQSVYLSFSTSNT